MVSSGKCDHNLNVPKTVSMPANFKKQYITMNVNNNLPGLPLKHITMMGHKSGTNRVVEIGQNLLKYIWMRQISSTIYEVTRSTKLTIAKSQIWLLLIN
ncbi:hypothetical protein ACH3XW_23955 [Acanthocheilonema viteae]